MRETRDPRSRRRRPRIAAALLCALGLLPAAAQEDVDALNSSAPPDPEVLQEFGEALMEEGADHRFLFETYLGRLGAVGMLEYVEDLVPRCHAHAHELGGAIYAESRDLELSLELCADRCTSGCMHGVVREALGGRSFESVVGAAPTFCETKPMAGAARPGNCAHALGSALMRASGYRREPALEACASLEGGAMPYYCATGVYMEYFANPGGLELDALMSLHHPCDSGPYPAACYRFKGTVMQTALGGDHAAFVDECLGLSGLQRTGCFHGLGAAYRAEVYAFPERLASLCKAGTRADRLLCIEGVVEKLADYDEERARKACGSLRGKLAAACEAAAAGKMYRAQKPTLRLYTGK